MDHGVQIPSACANSSLLSPGRRIKEGPRLLPSQTLEQGARERSDLSTKEEILSLIMRMINNEIIHMIGFSSGSPCQLRTTNSYSGDRTNSARRAHDIKERCRARHRIQKEDSLKIEEMDDLAGLEWRASSEAKKPLPMNFVYSDLRSLPASGRSSPFSGRSTHSNPPSQSATPANDNFANLVSFSSASTGKGISLLEQQRQLAEQKARQEAEKKAQLEAQYGGSNARFWDNLEQIGKAHSQRPVGKESILDSSINGRSQTQSSANDDDDILAAFNSSAPVDASTHFPVPGSSATPSSLGHLQFTSLNTQQPTTQHAGLEITEDDDPFGLGQMRPKPTPQGGNPQDGNDDDDILGLLAKPVSDFPREEPQEEISSSRRRLSPPESESLRDHSIAELVDMGFPVDKARQALATTESGTDVQAAIGWLLNEAHSESRRKQKGGNREVIEDQLLNGRHGRSSDRMYVPKGDLSTSRSARDQTERRSPAAVERDAAQSATEFGSSLLKTANTLWKSGAKKMQQAVQEFNVGPDPSQPRWMRETATSSDRHPRRVQEKNLGFGQQASQTKDVPMETTDMTDEALMLEAGKSRSTTSGRLRKELEAVAEPERFRSRSPATPPFRDSSPVKQTFQREQQKPFMSTATSRLARLAAEDQSHAYISPARRKQTPKPTTPESHPDLLEDSGMARQATPPASTSPFSQTRSEKPPVSIQAVPRAPPRLIPQASSSALTTSHQHREKGSIAFKRGDYSAAHASYSTALSLLPENHPVTIIILSNRALTSLKIGNPKSAISDADSAISIIGSSRGESEKIHIGGGMPSKDMREFFGKALMRKAEALEQLERWTEAAKVWQEAVESGHGGNTSIQGRNRCERATGLSKPGSRTSAPQSSAIVVQSKRRPQPPKKFPPQTAAPRQLGEAVARLRAANEAADRVDNEKFALADIVDSRLAAWKSGKQDNLRALLASLDSVLWPEAEWKKVSLAELVLPNKVKVQYMKGIAKVHPDKIPANATTEQKMIASSVFTILNEAWDKFKSENGF